MQTQRTPVLVVGGSLVGLSTSALLARYGVPHILVESHPGTAIHPRAASFHQRTMEAFRAVGVQSEVERAAELEFLQDGAIMAVESLGGKELHYFYENFNAGVEDLSPTRRLFITQVGLEPVLRERAEGLGADHRFNTEVTSLREQEDGVAAVLRPRSGGPDVEVVADYLIAADGAHSSVRKQLGIEMAGHGDFADCVTIYFRADVRELQRGRNLSVVYVNNADQFSFFRFSFDGQSGFLAVFATFDEAGNRNTKVGLDIDEAECIRLVRSALGCGPDLPIAVENVQYWTASAATAESFGGGRIFLAGDSAHVMPPTGGFGGNTGVADAYNLAWKLAMVHRGLAGPALLESYDAERRPLADLTVEQAYTRYVLRVDQSLSHEDIAEALDDASIELGGVHRSTAVVASDAPESLLVDPRSAQWLPGVRVPHVALGEESSLDLAADGFALLAPAGAQLAGSAAALAERTGIPLRVVEHDVDSGVPPVVLIRPDGVIAWVPAEPTVTVDQLAGVLDQILSRPAA
jgi:2-polyprenyl-6-methoxyphenol hydroxylase-like FAD-dependent oxidoreductase